MFRKIYDRGSKSFLQTWENVKYIIFSLLEMKIQFELVYFIPSSIDKSDLIVIWCCCKCYEIFNYLWEND